MPATDTRTHRSAAPDARLPRETVCCRPVHPVLGCKPLVRKGSTEMLKSIWRRVIGGHIAAAAFVLPALLVPPAPAGAQGAASAAASAQARIWVYRNFEPSLNLNLATVRLNGTVA